MQKEKGQKSEKKRRGFPVEWWDEECKCAIEKRKKALKEFKKEKTIIKFRKYREVKAETKNLLRKKKKDKFIDFVKGINKNKYIICMAKSEDFKKQKMYSKLE